ncbi:MAG TPA: hypothetical protein VE443_05725 [Beijerinckiaceae bacterium]|jgi:hypothetical protein|nr:hypothetical protein [Microvirga sp.]HZB37484.1 hypothetical protein [Beijerinckiaceae bacterium]
MWTVLGLAAIVLIAGGVATAGLLAWRSDQERAARGGEAHH